MSFPLLPHRGSIIINLVGLNLGALMLLGVLKTLVMSPLPKGSILLNKEDMPCLVPIGLKWEDTLSVLIKWVRIPIGDVSICEQPLFWNALRWFWLECKLIPVQPTYPKPICSDKTSIFGNFRVIGSIQVDDRPHSTLFCFASSTCQDSYRHLEVRWEDWGRACKPYHYIPSVVCI